MKYSNKLSVMVFFGAYLFTQTVIGDCQKDLNQMGDQLSMYGSIKTASCFAQFVPVGAGATLSGNKCTSKGNFANHYGLSGKGTWQQGNWGNTLDC